ncbi:hypothetical protein KUTeg_007299 [Tegillarca granosa]|uniref:Heparan-sulfate 6-O-sulfotransferase n=1 Tax=Tegillarca granosa TaxID=220873 RepID=A0ABQ9FCV2_TEGGR|nr:hypothetical protein KUTeg_007299 [Tegillarca granosa]
MASLINRPDNLHIRHRNFTGLQKKVHIDNYTEMNRFMITVLLVYLMIVLIGYICFQEYFSITTVHLQYDNIKDRGKIDFNPDEDVLTEKNDFNPDEDVLVILHIQKTGGSVFNSHLVNDLSSKIPCNCSLKLNKYYRCKCFTGNGNLPVFSPYSADWICGVHPYWTDLQECLEKAMDILEQKHRQRKFHYITMVRNPISRYLSELAHMQSHQFKTWRKVTRLLCNGKYANQDEVPYCYQGDAWENVDLQSFTNCEYNLAHNRQTRMLADMKKVNCYNKTTMSEVERNKIMLQSAKENLVNLDFFGLTEYQKETQILFEHKFNIKFDQDFVLKNYTVIKQNEISEFEKNMALSRNKLDIQLYSFAKSVFFKRIDFIRNMKN